MGRVSGKTSQDRTDLLSRLAQPQAASSCQKTDDEIWGDDQRGVEGRVPGC